MVPLQTCLQAAGGSSCFHYFGMHGQEQQPLKLDPCLLQVPCLHVPHLPLDNHTDGCSPVRMDLP